MPQTKVGIDTNSTAKGQDVGHVATAILKVVQRCNLNCTYCYVYNRGDDSWKDRPNFIGLDVVHQLAVRVAEHCGRYGMDRFTIELHGGEPLLLGKVRMQRLINTLRSECGAVDLRFTMQTNGLLLDEEWLDLFDKNQVSFGVSLDGPPEFADTRRVMRRGGGSTEQLLNTIGKLRRSGDRFDRLCGGVLCVVNPEANGAELVDWFVDNGFNSLDFLLPDGNYENPPQDWMGPQPYAEFLLSAFNRWYSLGKRAPRIRKFELMMMGPMGVKPTLDSLGGDLRQHCVVESDGSIGVNDVNRICGGEFSHDVINIFDHPLDAHVGRYRIAEIQQLSEQCQSCPHLSSCGGGYLPHRFDGDSFDHPSIYCEALFAVSQRIVEVLQADLPNRIWADANGQLQEV
jgi:uncharacterized protein